MGFFQSSFQEVGRTTHLIGELIALTTEQEEVLAYIGKAGHDLYKRNKIYDEPTLELCRKVDATLRLIEERKHELEDALEQSFGAPTDKDAVESVKGKAKRSAVEYMLKSQLDQHKKMLRDDYDEVGHRMVWLTTNDPRSVTPRIARQVSFLAKLKRDIDWRWDELQERTRNERKGPMFILVLNMFIVNFFRFTNHTWFRNWIRNFDYFQDKFMQRIHKEVQADLKLTEQEPGAPHSAPQESPDPFRPPAAPPPSPAPAGVAADEPPTVPVIPRPEPPAPGSLRARILAERTREQRPAFDAEPEPQSFGNPFTPVVREESRGWARPGRKAPDYHNAPADAIGGALSPASHRPGKADDEDAENPYH